MRTHYAFNPQRFLPPGDDPEGGYAWFLDTQLREPDAVVYVAERGGASSATCAPVSSRCRGRSCAVPPGSFTTSPSTSRRASAGVARELLAAAVGWLREHGAPRVMRGRPRKTNPIKKIVRGERTRGGRWVRPTLDRLDRPPQESSARVSSLPPTCCARERRPDPTLRQPRHPTRSRSPARREPGQP